MIEQKNTRWNFMGKKSYKDDVLMRFLRMKYTQKTKRKKFII